MKRDRRVRDDVPGDAVGIALRHGAVEAPLLKLRVPLLDDSRPRLVALDRVRAGCGQRMERGIRCRRAGRHGRRELRGEHVREVGLGLFEMDRDRVGRVVDLDALDAALRRVPGIRLGPADVLEKSSAGRVELEVALDRRLEVAGHDWRPVGVLQPSAQREAVRHPVTRDARQRRREIRNEPRAGRSALVPVAEKREVHVPHDTPALRRVGEARVEVVGRLVHRDPELRELTRIRRNGRRRRSCRRCCRRPVRSGCCRGCTTGPAATCDEHEREERKRRSDRTRPPRKNGRLHVGGEI